MLGARLNRSLGPFRLDDNTFFGEQYFPTFFSQSTLVDVFMNLSDGAPYKINRLGVYFFKYWCMLFFSPKCASRPSQLCTVVCWGCVLLLVTKATHPCHCFWFGLQYCIWILITVCCYTVRVLIFWVIETWVEEIFK